jgi:NADPH:quinone reductase-like Zn-dependent oxidoreductase
MMMPGRHPRRPRAFWVATPGRGEIRELDAAPQPRPGDVLVETLFSGISRGTETLVFAGRVPAAQADGMRCPFQEGSFPAPVKYGYAAVGRVLEGPPALRGQAVFALHPHQTRFAVPADAVVLVPDGVPPERAVLAANMETALNGVWDAPVLPGDRVCVIGGGVVGLLAAWLAAGIPATEVLLLDPDPGKGQAAAALGLSWRASADGLSDDVDVIVHASGNPAGLRTGLALAGFETTILEMSWYGDQEATVPLGEAFHSRRLAIRCSQVGSVAPRQRARWTHRRRLQTALGLLFDPKLDALISRESEFDSLPDVMAELAAGRPALCHRIRY